MHDIDELKKQDPDFLKKAKRTGWVCPVCGNGSGADGDGITLNPNDPGRHYKCFKCGLSGDVIDLYGVYAGIEDDREKIRATADYYGVKTVQTAKSPKKRTREEVKRDETPRKATKNAGVYADFILQAEKNNNYEYLKNRGISEETQRRFHIGYVENWRSPSAPASTPASPRCIIPRDTTNYLARDTRGSEELTDTQRKYEKQNTGKTSLFNAEAIAAPVVFITEGEIDAMSFEEVGAEAVAMCSTANRRKILDLIQEEGRRRQAYVLALDSDEAGERAREELAEGLEELGLAFIVAELPNGKKDPNQFLTEDAEGFQSWVSSLQAEAREEVESGFENEYKAAGLLDFFRKAEEREDTFEASTGFNVLDRDLSGGLHEGLYIIGAISALGKTTFTLQLADQIARGGVDVLFFSLEMNKYELLAKSISRTTYDLKREAKTKNGRYIARNTQEVLNNRKYKEYAPEERAVISDALERYAEGEAERMYIYEGRFRGERLTVRHIRDIVRNHIEDTGRPCVVCVDYLQILAPLNPHATDKQNTDAAVFELKEISRDYKIPVVAISSFNRENYLEPVSMSSFKESGAVEYSSDVLIGLQFAGMEYREVDVTEKQRRKRLRDLFAENERKKRSCEPIDIHLKCLKNRNGYTFTLLYRMVAAFNHFDELLTEYGYKEFAEKTGESWDKVGKSI